jgi:hypothetical protein
MLKNKLFISVTILVLCFALGTAVLNSSASDSRLSADAYDGLGFEQMLACDYGWAHIPK